MSELPAENLPIFDVIYWKELQLRIEKDMPPAAYEAQENNKPINFLKAILGAQWNLVAVNPATTDEMIDLIWKVCNSIKRMNNVK